MEYTSAGENSIDEQANNETKACRKAELKMYLSFDVRIEDLLKDASYVLPHAMDVWLENTRSQQKLMWRDGMHGFFSPLMRNVKNPSIHELFMGQKSMPTNAIIITSRIVSALRARRITIIMHMDIEQKTKSTQYYVTEFVSLVQQFAIKARTINTRDRTEDDAMLLFSPVVRSLLQSCTRI